MMSPLKISNKGLSPPLKCKPGLTTAHAKLLTNVVDLFGHALGAHGQNSHSETPSALLRAIALS